jgi:hypothetical protein
MMEVVESCQGSDVILLSSGLLLSLLLSSHQLAGKMAKLGIA